MKRSLFCPRLMALLIAIVMTGALMVMPAAPAMAVVPLVPTATLELIPDYPPSPVPGGTFDVIVRGTGNIHTSGAQVFLKYDPIYVQPQSVAFGADFNDLLGWSPDNVNGVMGIFPIVPLNATAPVVEWIAPNTTVDLCTITFEAKAATGPSCTEIAFLTNGADNTLALGEVTLITGSPDMTEPVDVIPGPATSLTVCISCKGDFDWDGDIDIFDFIAFKAAYRTVKADPNYNAIGDFDNDGNVDIFDFIAFKAVYRTSC